MTRAMGQAQAAVELARLLGELRRRARLSLRDLEEKGGWCYSTFWRAEREDWPPPTEDVLEVFLIVCERAIAERTEIDNEGERDADSSASEGAWTLWRVATGGRC